VYWNSQLTLNGRLYNIVKSPLQLAQYVANGCKEPAVVTSPQAEPVLASEASTVPSNAGVAVGAQPAVSASSDAAGVYCKQSELQMVYLMI